MAFSPSQSCMFVQIKHFQDESYDEIKFETFLQEK